jgi:hypothetical protein
MILSKGEIEFARNSHFKKDIEKTSQEIIYGAIEKLQKQKMENSNKLNLMEEFRPSDPVDRIDYLYQQITKCLCLSKGCTVAEINVLWSIFKYNYEQFSFFTSNYYYQILKENDRYHSNIIQHIPGSIILACLLQKISGKNKSFTEHATRTFSYLVNNYNYPIELARKVMKLIESSKDINYDLEGDERVFLNLKLSHLGCPFDLFLTNQENLQKDVPFFTKLEFYKLQQKIYEKLIKQNKPIFNLKYFTDKFEDHARLNIHRYFPILKERIAALESIKNIEETGNPVLDTIPTGT